MKNTLIIILSLGVIAFGYCSLTEPVGTPEGVAYEMCNDARIYDTVKEDTCGEILDYYNLEFRCEESNKNSTTKCQVERAL